MGKSSHLSQFSSKNTFLTRQRLKCCTLDFDVTITMFLNGQHSKHRQGLAMLEVMIAVGLLTLAVAAISSALVAGQQHSLEARITIVASVAAESLLSTISQEPWETIDSWHGYTEEIGSITDPTGITVGGDWGLIGRKISIVESDIYIEPLQVYIIGRTVTVITFTHDGRELISVGRFIPEPQS